jgi:hypothetical protein
MSNLIKKVRGEEGSEQKKKCLGGKTIWKQLGCGDERDDILMMMRRLLMDFLAHLGISRR